MCNAGSELKKYTELNSISRHGGAVFFGSDYFAELPVSELANDFNIATPVYNRSMERLSITDIEDIIETCIVALHPGKVFLNLGETDIENDTMKLEDLVGKYEWLLYTLHRACSAEIYIVSVISSHPGAAKLNAELKKLAQETGCKYIDAVSALRSEKPAVKVFNAIKHYLHPKSIDFADAMSLA